jgi:hypothetical protein
MASGAAGARLLMGEVPFDATRQRGARAQHVRLVPGAIDGFGHEPPIPKALPGGEQAGAVAVMLQRRSLAYGKTPKVLLE